MSEDSIEFSLSIAEQRAVGFIPAWSLAFLHYYDLAKWLSYYLYFFFFSFSFILDLLHRRECGKVSCHIVTVTWQEVTASHHMMSHDRHGKVVHRLCSSCISNVENLMGALLSSLCQTLIKEQLALFWLRSWLTDNYHIIITVTYLVRINTD